MAFGRFIELSLYNRTATTPQCAHPLHESYERLVGCGTLVASFIYEPCVVFDVTPPLAPRVWPTEPSPSEPAPMGTVEVPHACANGAAVAAHSLASAQCAAEVRIPAEISPIYIYLGEIYSRRDMPLYLGAIYLCEIPRRCLSAVSWRYLGDTSAIYLGDISAISRRCSG